MQTERDFSGLAIRLKVATLLTVASVLFLLAPALVFAGNGFERGLVVAANPAVSLAVADLAAEEISLRCAAGLAAADSVAVTRVIIEDETIDQGVVDTLTTLVVVFRQDSLPPRTAVVQIREYAMSAEGINPVAVVAFDGPPGLCR